MFQVNFEEQQNGVIIKRRLFDMLFASKTVAIEEINMGTFIAQTKNYRKSDFCPALFSIFEKEKITCSSLLIDKKKAQLGTK